MTAYYKSYGIVDGKPKLLKNKKNYRYLIIEERMQLRNVVNVGEILM